MNKFIILGLFVLLIFVATADAQTVEFLEGSKGECGWNNIPCYASYNITASGKDLVLDENTFWFEFRDEQNMTLRHAQQVNKLNSWKVRLASPTYQEYPFWVSDMDCNTIVLDSHGVEQCKDNGAYETRKRLKYTFLKNNEMTLQSGKSIIAYVSGMKKPMTRVDNVLVLKQNNNQFKKYEEWYWWGAYPFYNSSDPTNANLTAYWSFDNATSSYAWDDLNGTTHDFDATDSSFPTPNSTAYLYANSTGMFGSNSWSTGTDTFDPAGNYSFAAWWNYNASSTGEKIILDNGAQAGEITMFANTALGRIGCTARLGGGNRDAQVNHTIVFGEWYFTVCTVSDGASSDNISVMLFNKTSFMGQTSSVASYGALVDAGHPLLVGERNSGAKNWRGAIDEVGIWDNRILSRLEAEALWNLNTTSGLAMGCQPFKNPTCNATASAPAGPGAENFTQTFNLTPFETSLANFTINITNATQNVTNINFTWNLTGTPSIQFTGSNIDNTSGTNWTLFNTSIRLNLTEINNTAVQFQWNWTYTNSTNENTSPTTQNIQWAYYPRTLHLTTPILTLQLQNITLNLTKETFTNGVSFSNAIEYNLTNNTIFLVNNQTTYEDHSYNFMTPGVLADTTVTAIGWTNVTFNGLTFTRNTSNISQLISTINVTAGNCSGLTGYEPVLNFTFHDEFDNDTITQNGSSQITLWSTNDTVNITHGFDYNATTFHEICVQGSNFTFNANYLLQYFGEDLDTYPVREFHKRRQPIDTTVEQYHLYNLLTTNSTEIIFTVKNVNEQIIDLASIEAHKYNISNNSFRIVDVGVTDFQGQTRLRLHQADDFYKFIVRDFQNNILLETDNFKLLFTEYFLRVGDPDFVSITDFIQLRNIQHTLRFDNTTDIIRLTWNDVNNVSGIRPHCLRITNLTQFNGTLLNQQCSQNQTGTFSYSTASINGTLVAQYTVGEDSFVIDAISVILDVIRNLGSEGAFLAFILIGTLSAMGLLVSPTLSIVFLIFGLVAGTWIGVLTIPWIGLGSIIALGIIIGFILNKEP